MCFDIYMLNVSYSGTSVQAVCYLPEPIKTVIIRDIWLKGSIVFIWTDIDIVMFAMHNNNEGQRDPSRRSSFLK